jgi:carboxypeptidase C (cathepsin A)
MAQRLASYTGLPAAAWEKTLRVSDGEFSRRLLAAEGLQVGTYDSRYTLPLAGSGADPVADDPAMARYVPGFVAAFHQMLADDLKVDMDRPYGAIVWKDLLPAWNWNRGGVAPGQSFATDLAVAMRRNEKLRVLVASGYYDLATHSAPAEYSVEQAKLPAERVTLRRYASGHMLYLGDTAEAFANDVRALIRQAR